VTAITGRAIEHHRHANATYVRCRLTHRYSRRWTRWCGGATDYVRHHRTLSFPTITLHSNQGGCAAALAAGSVVPQAALPLPTRHISGNVLSMRGAVTVGVPLWRVRAPAMCECPIVIASVMALTTIIRPCAAA
jgi:hypothetical protein